MASPFPPIASTRPMSGRPNGVTGVPSNYRPAHQPVNPQPGPGQTASYPAALYDTNMVDVRLANGSVQRTNLNTNVHPWINQLHRSPKHWLYYAFAWARILRAESSKGV